MLVSIFEDWRRGKKPPSWSCASLKWIAQNVGHLIQHERMFEKKSCVYDCHIKVNTSWTKIIMRRFQAWTSSLFATGFSVAVSARAIFEKLQIWILLCMTNVLSSCSFLCPGDACRSELEILRWCKCDLKMSWNVGRWVCMVGWAIAGSSAFGPVCQSQFLGTFGDQFSTGSSPAECNWGARRGSATWLLEFSGRWSTTLARQGWWPKKCSDWNGVPIQGPSHSFRCMWSAYWFPVTTNTHHFYKIPNMYFPQASHF
jgi:hypothetical protein